jgi:hypothetical protein
MIAPGAELKIYIATRPVDFRCGHDGLASKVQEMLGLDPFSGAAFVFRSKRAHIPTFNIRFASRHYLISVASAFRNGVTGGAFPPWQAAEATHHRPAAGLFTRGAAVDVRRRVLRWHDAGVS